jgi:hypothetical protein
MKTLAAIFLICLALSTSAALTAIRRETCSCAADDGSCNVSGTCPKGCFAFCPSGGCRVYCVDSFESNEREKPSPTPTPRPTRPHSQGASTKLTWGPRRGAVSNTIRPHLSFSSDAPNAVLWDIRNSLTSDGGGQLSREDYTHFRAVRRALLNGEWVSVCFRNVPAGHLAQVLSFITGLNVLAEPADANTPVNYSGKGDSLGEIMIQVSKHSGVQFSIR